MISIVNIFAKFSMLRVPCVRFDHAPFLSGGGVDVSGFTETAKTSPFTALAGLSLSAWFHTLPDSVKCSCVRIL